MRREGWSSTIQHLTAREGRSKCVAELCGEGVVQDRIDCTGNSSMTGQALTRVLPVDVDAGLGKHQIPEVHEDALHAVEGGQGVVDHESTPGKPEGGKDCHNRDQHLHHLERKLKENHQ